MSFDSTEGCTFLSATFTSILWAVGTVQVYFYYDAHGKTDKTWLKCYVFVASVLNTIHSILILKSAYIYLVKDIGNVSELSTFQSSLGDSALLAALINLQVQLLFVYRTWMLSDKNKVLVGCFLVLNAGQFAAGVLYFVQTFHKTNFTAVENTSTLASLRASSALAGFIDTALALTLVVLLHRRRSGLRKMNSVVDRATYTIRTGLITEAWVYTIGTGLITGPWALGCLVTSIGLTRHIVYPNSYVHILMLDMWPKIYVNCVLTSLNMRRSLQHLAVRHRTDEVEMNNLSSQSSSSHFTPQDQVFFDTLTVEVKVEKDSEYFGEKASSLSGKPPPFSVLPEAVADCVPKGDTAANNNQSTVSF